MSGTYISSRYLAGLCAAAVALAGGSVPAMLSAESSGVAELKRRITQLQEKLARVSDGQREEAASCGGQFSRDLDVGAEGPQVKRLQQFLNERVEGIQVGQSGTPGAPGNETPYYGPKTAEAVTAFQEMFAAEVLQPIGLSRGTGYWGPSSRAQANELCGAATVDTGSEVAGAATSSGQQQSAAAKRTQARRKPPAPMELLGPDDPLGTFSDYEITSDPAQEDIYRGETARKVFGFEFDAEGGPLVMTKIDVTVSGDRRVPWDSFRRMSLWHDGEMIGAVPAHSQRFWSDEGQVGSSAAVVPTASASDILYTTRISNFTHRLEEGDDHTFYVAMSVKDKLDSADVPLQWNIFIDDYGLRTYGAGNAVQENGNEGPSGIQTFTVSSRSRAGVQISGGFDAVNDSRVIEIDASDDTDDVELLRFDMAIGAGGDVVLDDLPVTFTTNADPTDVATDASLWIDGERVVREDMANAASPNSSSTILTFSNLERTLEAGERYEMTVTADINETGSTADEGDTLSADIGETETDNSNLDLEDASGEQLADSDVEGAANGEEHIFFDNAFTISDTATSFDLQDTSDTNVDVKGVYTFTFDITSFGADLYLATTTASTSASGDQGIEYRLTGDDPAGASISDTFSLTGETETGGGGDAAWAIEEGDTEEVELQVFVDNSGNSSGVFGVEVDTIRFTDSQDSGFGTGSYLSDIANYADSISSPTGNLDELDIANQSLN